MKMKRRLKETITILKIQTQSILTTAILDKTQNALYEPLFTLFVNNGSQNKFLKILFYILLGVAVDSIVHP